VNVPVDAITPEQRHRRRGRDRAGDRRANHLGARARLELNIRLAHAAGMSSGLSRRSDYVELRCRSAFSFLDGASLPEDLIATAATLGYDALALADVNGVAGAPRFFGAARRAGVRALVGAEVTLDAAGHDDRDRAGARGARKSAAATSATTSTTSPPPVLLLVENRTGYKNLCRLLTRVHADRPKGTGTATHALLAEHASGLTALAGATAREDLPALQRAFGRDHLYLEVQRHFDAPEAHRARAVLAQAAALRVPIVATNDVRYATRDRRRVHDVLACARLGVTVDEIGRRLSPSAEHHLKSSAEMTDLFRDLPAAVRATRTIADRCAFTLADLGYTFPTYPVPDGGTEQSYLEILAWRGAADRYRPLHDRARRQIARELEIIGKLGLAGYFLVVWDIVQFARGRGIFIQGRGSAANSALCYALGITAVDPVGMDLLFERFLSEERVHGATNVTDRMPDIDLDLPSGDRRESVIQYVYATYGAGGAAMTANVISYRPRLAMRTCGRALGFSEEQLSRVSKMLPGWVHADPESSLGAYLKMAGFPLGETRTRLLADIATELLDLPRHLGQHSGGMVIAAGRLDDVVPLEPASMPGRVIVQWDKDDCADLGIVKVDLLGLGMLAVLEDAVPLIERHQGVKIDYAHLPPDDPRVYEMLRAADTVGVFQVESRAQMATLPRMRPERFYDLVVEVAIIRPGPIVGKMVNPYLLRRAGREDVRYAHPSLEPILRRTLGVPLFQEQLIRMAMVAAGFTGGQADELRRAMGFKRSEQRMNAIETALRAGMAKNGITGVAQEEIIAGIKSFALYGFPESHAASFALIAYASAYLKAHHPAAFACALLNNYPMGFYHPSTLVNDAARHGVTTLPVDVTRSTWLCDLEAPQPDRLLRLGLKYVGGLREEIGKRIEQTRVERPFTSLVDFEARVHPNAAELANLATVGALGALGGTRRQALWQVEALGRSGPLFDRGDFASSARSGPPAPPLAPIGEADLCSLQPSRENIDQVLPEMSRHDEVLADFRGTGVSPGPHPMTFVRDRLRAHDVVTAMALTRIPSGRRARVAGIVVVRQRPGTAKGFVFLTIEDETGFANAIITPRIFEANRQAILALGAMIVEGKVQNQDGVVSIKADQFLPLPGPTPTSTEAMSSIDISHDFH
jgi:error-prone DNA polymerase